MFVKRCSGNCRNPAISGCRREMKRFLFVGLLACALGQAQEIKSGFFRGHPIHYKVVDGMAITEGDILLDAESTKTPGKEAIGRTDNRYRWPDGIVPYSIDPGFPNMQRITDAVKHWNENTQLRLVPRVDQGDYVRFVRRASGCSSFVGLIGGAQAVNLGDEC